MVEKSYPKKGRSIDKKGSKQKHKSEQFTILIVIKKYEHNQWHF